MATERFARKSGKVELAEAPPPAAAEELEELVCELEGMLKTERDARRRAVQTLKRERKAAEAIVMRAKREAAASERQLHVVCVRLADAERRLAERHRPLWRKLLRLPPAG